MLGRVELLHQKDRVFNAAGVPLSPELRSLDAIHLATAGQLGSDIGQIVTSDDKLLEAAQRLGFKTASPA